MLSGRLYGVGLLLGVLTFGLSVTHGANASPSQPHADIQHGKAIFLRTCGVCHGLNRQGGSEGPALKNIVSKITHAQLIAWIEKPRPPMPALYPGQLSKQSVYDVAAYVETLK